MKIYSVVIISEINGTTSHFWVYRHFMNFDAAWAAAREEMVIRVNTYGVEANYYEPTDAEAAVLLGRWQVATLDVSGCMSANTEPSMSISVRVYRGELEGSPLYALAMQAEDE